MGKQFVDQKYRKVKENVPVTKYRTEFDTVSKTIYEDAWRTKVVPVTKIVRKEIPVFNVVLNDDCGNCDQVDQVYARAVGNVTTGNPDRTEQETYQSEADSGAMHQPELQAATSGVVNQPVAPPSQRQVVESVHQAVDRPSSRRQAVGAAHQTVTRPSSRRQAVGAAPQTMAHPASLRQATTNQMVNQAPAAPMRAPVQATNYHDGGQWMKQPESAPATNETTPQYDHTMQQVYSVPQQYTPRRTR